MALQMAFSVRQMSQHADEAVHLYAGYRALKCGDFTFGREHPPLAKMIAAAPLLLSAPSLDCHLGTVGVPELAEATKWLYAQSNWWSLLMRARMAAGGAAIILLLAVWACTRWMFGNMAAAVAGMIVAFEPSLLGHGALVLNDTLMAALFLLTVIGFYWWTRTRTVPALLVTGFCLGLALLTKHSGGLLVFLLVLLALAEAWLQKNTKRALQNLWALALIAVIAAGTIWCGYGIRYTGGIRRADGTPPEQVARLHSVDVEVLKIMRAGHILPQPYIDGLIDVRTLITKGQGERLLGKYYADAPWFYFPLTLSIKCTLGFLLLVTISAFGLAIYGRDKRLELLFLLLPIAVYLIASMRVVRFGGIWHLFPLLPFLVISAAGGCVMIAQRYRHAAMLLVLFLAFHALSSLRSFPNYLSYANEAWGGTGNIYKLLPNTDLAQTFWQVAQYMEKHPGTPCWIESNFWAPPEPYKVPCIHMGDRDVFTEVPPHMEGIAFISATSLEVESPVGGPLSTFLSLRPSARLGGSAMLVYEGQFDTRIAAARALIIRSVQVFNEGRPDEALYFARQAVDTAPSYARAHELYCLTLATNGRPQEGLPECALAVQQLRADPRGEEEARTVLQQMMFISEHFRIPLPDGIRPEVGP
jgi:hypothetical protein